MSGSSHDVSARQALEEYLVGVWRHALGTHDIGLNDDFFELGGDSLAAMQVAAQVADRFQLEVATVMAFDRPTVSELAAAVEQALTERAEALSDGEAAERLAASHRE